MFTEEALSLIQTTAIRACAVRTLETSHPTVALPDGIKLQSIEHLHQRRFRFRGTYSTSVLADFCGLAKGRATDQAIDNPVSVFVNADDGEAKAFFNLGTPENPGHADDVALLRLDKTAAYAAALAINSKNMTQKALAEWLEDWFDILTPIASHGDAAATVTQAIAAVRDITISTKGERNSIQNEMNASRSALEEIEAKSRKQLPVGFTFRAQPFAGFAERAFTLRLSVLPSDTPLLALRIVGLDAAKESIANEFEGLVHERLEGVRLFRGRFQA